MAQSNIIKPGGRMFARIFVLLLLANAFVSCSKLFKLEARVKGFLGQEYARVLMGAERECEEADCSNKAPKMEEITLEEATKAAAGRCSGCRHSLKRLEFLNVWLEAHDTLTFKDEVGRNKLMILVNDFKASSFFRRAAVKRALELLRDRLEKTPGEIEHFDSEDRSGNRSITYLIAAGMIDEAKDFASVSTSLQLGYDMGLCSPSLEENGISPICLLVPQIRKAPLLKNLMEELVIPLVPTVLTTRVDKAGNTLVNIAVFSGNMALLDYIIQNTSGKESLRMKNLEAADALSTSLRFFRHNMAERILKVKGLFDFYGKDREYGRELLIYAASFANDEGVRLLVERGAFIDGKAMNRFLKIVKRVGNVALDLSASVVDTAASYGSAYFLGSVLQVDIAKAAVDSVRRNFASLNRSGFCITEGQEATSVRFVKEFIKRKGLKNPFLSEEAKKCRMENENLILSINKCVRSYQKDHGNNLQDSKKSEDYRYCLREIEGLIRRFKELVAAGQKKQPLPEQQEETNSEMEWIFSALTDLRQGADNLLKKEK